MTVLRGNEHPVVPILGELGNRVRRRVGVVGRVALVELDGDDLRNRSAMAVIDI